MSYRTANILSIILMLLSLTLIIGSTYVLCTDVLPFDWTAAATTP